MRVRDIRERTLPLRSNLRNAYVDFATMTASLVAVESDVIRNGQPVTGYGFCSPGRYAQGEIIRDRVVPRLLQAGPGAFVDQASGTFDPILAHEIMRIGEKPGGHGSFAHAVGAVDLALWDLAAKLEDVSLARLVARRFGDGRIHDAVWVYAAGGYYSSDGTVGTLAEELTTYLASGFAHVKMKIGGLPLEVDRERVAAAVDVAGEGSRVAVDANGRFGIEEALAYADMLAAFDLLWYEEPGDPLDFELSRLVVEHYDGVIANGENLFSVADVRNLLRYGGMCASRDYLLMDPALSYGITEYVRMVLAAERTGWSRERFVPHGGHQANLALAAGLGLGGTECYPGVFGPIGGFAAPVEIRDGYASVVELPGIGIEAKPDLWAEFAQLRN